MANNNTNSIVQAQYNELIEYYPDLELTENGDGSFVISGILEFEKKYKSTLIEDKFHVEINVPKKYPDELPIVRETGNRIPKEFHINTADNTLCLGTLYQIKKEFSLGMTLFRFVDEILVLFLYEYCYFKKFNKMPWGERSHGEKGMIESYRNEFNIDNDFAVLGFLKLLAVGNFRGHLICPCGSGEKLRNCHRDQLLGMALYLTPIEYSEEYIKIFNYLMKSGVDVPMEYYTESIKKQLKKRLST